MCSRRELANARYTPHLGRGAIGRLACSYALVIAVVASCGLTAEGAEQVRELGRVRTKRLAEVSGLAASKQNPGILWMHNDGAASEVYAVKLNGNLAARVDIQANVEDLEDIALGPGPVDGVDYLYLGDIGDNLRSRREIRIIRFPEPVLHERDDRRFMIENVEVRRLAYPNGSFDAEALMVDPVTGDLLLVTKERRRARMYVARADRLQQDSVVTLEQLAEFRFDRVTGGDISRDGNMILLRNKDQGWLWSRRRGEGLEDAVARPPRQVPVRCPGQGEQGEAVAFHPSGFGYYTMSEGEREIICVFGLGRIGTGRIAE